MTEKTEKTWKVVGFILGTILIPTIAVLATLGIIHRPTPKPAIVAKIKQGETRNLPFGDYAWRVLDVQNDRALLITEDIIEKRPYYDELTDVTWETCTLRGYLNGNFFYGNFSAQEQALILEITNANLDNQWYGTNGSNPTKDKVFLLSIAEVVRYFGDSGQLKNNNPDSEYWIGDQYSSERVAKFNNGGFWWWLRSPGYYPFRAAIVDTGGYVGLNGNYVGDREGGVRPALWLNL